jgi:hypothetical protein
VATKRKKKTAVSRRRRGASPALKKTQAQVISLRSRLRNMRSQQTGIKAVQADWKTSAKTAVAVAGGGAIGGAAQFYTPDGIAGFDTRLAVGAGMVALGALVLKGDAAALVVCGGAGMLAGYAQDQTYNMIAQTQTATS